MPENLLLAACQNAVPEILNLTEQLVNMDSGSDDLVALHSKADFLAKLFQNCGASVRLEEADAPRLGSWNVISEFHGTGTAKVLILTHYDTVFPAGEAARRPFSCDGESAHGPGVADMQASIAMLGVGIPLLHSIFAAQNYDTLTIFCNADEEIGSWGGRRQIQELARHHDVTLNMELSGAKGDLITVSGRGMANGILRVTGVAAHSGAEPPAGSNAGLELAHQMLQLQDLSNPEIRTAVNCTVGSFGTKPNVIPDTAEAVVNIRVAQAEEFSRIEQEIKKRITNRLISGCEVTFDMKISIMPYSNNPVTLALADKVRELAKKELGMEIGYRHAIGGNDTSFSAQVCPSLDGFGPGCVAMHSVQETLPVRTIAPRLYILLRTLQEIFAGNFVPLKRTA